MRPDGSYGGRAWEGASKVGGGQDPDADCHSEGTSLGNTEKREQQYWCKLMAFSSNVFPHLHSFHSHQ